MRALAEIAAFLDAPYQGDPSLKLRSIASLSGAKSDQLSFCTDRKHLAALQASQAGAVIVPAELPELRNKPARINHANPYLAYARLAAWWTPAPPLVAGVHSSAVVHPTARVAASARLEAGVVVAEGAHIGERCHLHAGVKVGAKVEMGEGCELYPNVVIYHDVKLGDRVRLHSGVVIGSDGFGFAPTREGPWVKIPQTGRVLVGDDVEVGANTTVDRGALDDTIIGRGVIIDNQVQIGHNVEIGEFTAIAGCAGIAGSAKIGRRCMIRGAAMVNGHITICDGVVVSGGTLVASDITAPGRYTAVFPIAEHSAWVKIAATLRRSIKRSKST